MNPIPQADIDWSQKLNFSIRVGGEWGIPRSGLIFRKLSEHEWSLESVMPWSAGVLKAFMEGQDVPKDCDALLTYQRTDFECIRSRFEAAGLKLTDPKNLLRVEPVTQTAYFTFGFDHIHSVGGFTYDKDVVVKITAPDPRGRMFEVFGRKWAMQYDSIEAVDLNYYPRGVKELP